MPDPEPPPYVPDDQDKHLGPSPWSPEDPALKAWEAAHGHDVRLKCIPEFGCLVIETELEWQVDKLTAQLDEANQRLNNVRSLCLQYIEAFDGDSPYERVMVILTAAILAIADGMPLTDAESEAAQ